MFINVLILFIYLLLYFLSKKNTSEGEKEQNKIKIQNTKYKQKLHNKIS